MKREIKRTADGSHTVFLPRLNVTYHSTHGAIQESRHVFIEAGLEYALSRFSYPPAHCLRVFEMGFGTGLNALLSYKEMTGREQCLYYYATELYPFLPEEAAQLNYVQQLGDEKLSAVFTSLHEAAWNKETVIDASFTLYKSNLSLLETTTEAAFHLIYFDAFAPDAQPELWTADVFAQLYTMLQEGGALVTYCSKGAVRRRAQSVGFTVEKLKGPPGKREIIRAVKRGA